MSSSIREKPACLRDLAIVFMVKAHIPTIVRKVTGVIKPIPLLVATKGWRAETTTSLPLLFGPTKVTCQRTSYVVCTVLAVPQTV